MSSRKLRVFLVSLVVAAGGAAPAAAPVDRAIEARRRGTETLDAIEHGFRLPGSGLYAQEIHPADPAFRPGPAFAWGEGVQLSALAAAARVDRPRYLPDLRRFVDALDRYWVVADDVGGYDVGPGPKPLDRYYDDNAWLALALIETYEVTRDVKDLARARATAKFVLSGEDDALGGGIWWHEQKRESKNTCVAAPATVMALRLARVTNDRAYADAADRLYRWTRATLQDPADGLYFDNVGVRGKVEKTKWSYNAALMIRAACLRFDRSGDAAELREAERVAASAEKRWVKPGSGCISDGAAFAHLLNEALLELSARDHDPRWSNDAHRALEYLWSANRDPQGWHPERWDASPAHDVPKVRLIDQAAAARAFFRAAWPEPSPPQ